MEMKAASYWPTISSDAAAKHNRHFRMTSFISIQPQAAIVFSFYHATKSPCFIPFALLLSSLAQTLGLGFFFYLYLKELLSSIVMKGGGIILFHIIPLNLSALFVASVEKLNSDLLVTVKSSIIE